MSRAHGVRVYLKRLKPISRGDMPLSMGREVRMGQT